MKLVIVIPAFNESQVIFKVLRALPRNLDGISDISVIVVDDGSQDKTSLEAKRARVHVIRHFLNRGVGAATKTGLEWAKKNGADIVVTFDADGQHAPEDIKGLIRPIILQKADIVIGSRLRGKHKMPVDRFLINWLANFVTLVLFGVFSTDSQSGLRAFSKHAVELLDFKFDRMEFSSEVLLEAKRSKLKVVEIPTKAIYTKYSRTKGQKNTNALPIFTRFLVRILR